MNEFRKIEGKLTTITPLAIDSGNKIYRFEYWSDSGKIFVGDFEKLINALMDADWEKNYKKLLSLFRTISGKTFLDMLAAFGLADRKNEFIVKEIKKGNAENIDTEIEEFIAHPNGSVFIPGSSIKGAIMTALLKGKKLSGFEDNNNISIPDIELCKAKRTAYRVGRIGMKNHSEQANLNAIECIEVNDIDVQFGVRINLDMFIKTINDYNIQTLSKTMNISCVKNNIHLMQQLKMIESSFSPNCIVFQLGRYGGYFTKSCNRQKYLKTFPVASSYIPLGWVSVKLR